MSLRLSLPLLPTPHHRIPCITFSRTLIPSTFVGVEKIWLKQCDPSPRDRPVELLTSGLQGQSHPAHCTAQRCTTCLTRWACSLKVAALSALLGSSPALIQYSPVMLPSLPFETGMQRLLCAVKDLEVCHLGFLFVCFYSDSQIRIGCESGLLNSVGLCSLPGLLKLSLR